MTKPHHPPQRGRPPGDGARPLDDFLESLPEDDPRRIASRTPKRPFGPNLSQNLRRAELASAEYVESLHHHKGIRLGIDLDTRQSIWHTDRFRHFYVLGRTGSGKSNLFQQMIIQDMHAGLGVGVLAREYDQVINEILPFVPPHRVNDVLYLNPEATHPLCVNPLELAPGENPAQRVEQLMAIFSSMLNIEGAALRPLCEAMLWALVSVEGTSLADIPRFLDRNDPGYRHEILEAGADDLTKSYFKLYESKSFQKGIENFIINRFIVFQRRPALKNIMCGKTTLRLKDAMNESAIFIANLSDATGIFGGDSARILGAYLIASLKAEVFNRQALPPEKRKPFLMYIDEFDTFLADASNVDAFEEFLRRARKNNVALHLAHQDTSSLPDRLDGKIQGNVGTRVYFQLGEKDATRYARGILIDTDTGPATINASDLLSLGVGECWASIRDSDNRPRWHKIKTTLFDGQGNKTIRDQIISQSEAYIPHDEEGAKPPEVGVEPDSQMPSRGSRINSKASKTPHRGQTTPEQGKDPHKPSQKGKAPRRAKPEDVYKKPDPDFYE